MIFFLIKYNVFLQLSHLFEFTLLRNINRNPAASGKMSNILDITKLSIEPMKLMESFQFFFGVQVD